MLHHCYQKDAKYKGLYSKLCSYVQRVHNSYVVICQRDAPLCNDYLNVEMETIYYLTYTAEQ